MMVPVRHNGLTPLFVRWIFDTPAGRIAGAPLDYWVWRRKEQRCHFYGIQYRVRQT
jgi:hypothetical protein